MSSGFVTLALVLAMSPFEKNDPLVDEGMSAYDQGRYDEAVAKFEAAAKERPQDPRVQFNLGAALHKAGKNAEARTALTRALELDPKHEYANQIHYNLGNVDAADDKKEDAVKEYRKALRADPSDELSRHNLEVLLKNLPPKQHNSPDGGTDGGHGDAGHPDGGSPDAGHDAGVDAGPPGDGGAGDAGQGDAGQPDGGNDGGMDGGADAGHNPGDAGQGDGGRGDGGQGDQDKKGDGGQDGDQQRSDAGSDGGADRRDAGEPNQEQPMYAPDGGLGMSKKDAEKALDAMKNSEKNLQLWRFRQKTQKNDTHGKDW